jgi:hypothetical protein
MTAREKKIIRLKKLVADINNDLGAIARLSSQVKTLDEEINSKSGPLADRDVMLMAAYLHHFYTGLESIFERISQNIDGGISKQPLECPVPLTTPSSKRYTGISTSDGRKCTERSGGFETQFEMQFEIQNLA